ncbi:MAG: FkbM family methyltransferase [Moorea sp. SIO3G5]|nr:FkbM family methyltransferase [Moorena sp. SIO3G5]
MNTELTQKLDDSLSFYKTSRLNRLLKSPNRLLYSTLISAANNKLTMAVPAKARTFFEEEMKVILPEIVSTTIYRYGFFEEGLTTFMLNYLKPGMIFFDVGTHFGFFSMLGSHLVGKNGQVHSFEPTKSTFELLKENTKDKENIVLTNKAVWSDDATLSFNDYGIRNSAFNSVYTSRWIQKAKFKTYDVKALSIDSYIRNTGLAPNFIKIDAESSEYKILKGMERTLTEIKPIVTIEVGDMGVEGAVSTRELITYMVDKGYQALEFKDGKIKNQCGLF